VRTLGIRPSSTTCVRVSACTSGRRLIYDASGPRRTGECDVVASCWLSFSGATSTSQRQASPLVRHLPLTDIVVELTVGKPPGLSLVRRPKCVQSADFTASRESKQSVGRRPRSARATSKRVPLVRWSVGP
jgi:hypothetical protein